MSAGDKKAASLAAMAVVEDRVEELKALEQRWTDIVTSIERAAASAKTRIVLDVGGTRFGTSKETLLRFVETYFTGLLGSGRWQPCEDGSYPIDRNPKGFDYVLDYMRTGQLTAFGVNTEVLECIRGHLDYFLLPNPSAFQWGWNKEVCGSGLTLTGKIVTKTGAGGWNAGVLGCALNPTSFKVKVLARVTGHVMVGFAPHQTFRPNGLNHNTSGYYIYVASGGLYSHQGDGNRAYRAAINNDSVIEVLWNPQTREISFVVDGTNHGVAFTVNTPDLRLYPALDVHDEGASVELIQ